MPELRKARETAAEIGWLKDVPSGLRDAVLERTTLCRLKGGEILHFSGDDAIGMYGLVTGRLRILVASEEHGSYFVHLLHPGAWIGEGPSITGRPRVVTPVASCDCELLFLPRVAVHEIVLGEPSFWTFFFAPLMGHFEVSAGIVADLLMRDHRKRIVASLLRLAGCRLGPLPRNGQAQLEASQEDIAIMSNVVRTSVGTVFRELADAGLIEVGYGRVQINSVRRLREMLRRPEAGRFK